jgi:prevent-host-death family protein
MELGRLRRKDMSRQAVIKASEGHRAFGKLLRRVYRSDEHLIVERDGFPVAVLLSFQEYEKLRREKALAAFEEFSREFGREIESRGPTEEGVVQEVEKAKHEVYEEKYGHGAG